MASRARQAAVTAAYVAQQRLLVSTLARDLLTLLRVVFNVGVPGQSWPTTRIALDALIRDRRRRSADLAARYYVNLRSAADLAPRPPMRLQEVSSPPAVRLDPGTGLVRTVSQVASQLSAETEAQSAAADGDFAGLEPISEEDAWAELERIAGVLPEPADELDGVRVTSNLDATGIGVFQKAVRSGKTPQQALDTMALNLAGSAATLAQEGGRGVVRDAVEGDRDAIGWARITDSDPCSWCAMLASRGAVYKSERTAGGAQNDRFEGEGAFKWHNHCGCQAIPIFDPGDPHLVRADDLYDQWLRVTSGTSGKAARNAWRRYWENREGK